MGILKKNVTTIESFEVDERFFVPKKNLTLKELYIFEGIRFINGNFKEECNNRNEFWRLGVVFGP